jgi:hypothetical protein
MVDQKIEFVRNINSDTQAETLTEVLSSYNKKGYKLVMQSNAIAADSRYNYYTSQLVFEKIQPQQPKEIT